MSVSSRSKREQYNDIPWQQTCCILCALNCGIEVKVKDGEFVKIRGDKSHPVSEGYLCQKAARLNHYQNHLRRIRQPLKRQPNGEFQPLDWGSAIKEIAGKINQIKNEHGGIAFAYYGGGGQANHLPGLHASALRAAIGTPYYYSSLAQEKTGDFWVNGRLFGRQTCHVTEGIHEADFVMLIGTNSFQSHGFPQARKVLREISKDPNRTLVVVDPRRTKTADLADVHLPIKPGTDAFLMTAMLAQMVQENLVDHDFIAARTVGFEQLADLLGDVDVSDYIARCELDESVVRQVTRDLAAATAASTRHDLGVEMSLHSTLNTYLEKLLFLFTGNFGKPGANNLHTQFAPLIGHSPDFHHQGNRRTKVSNMAEISKIYPPNILPQEVLSDQPDRLRALIVDSSNPMQTAADTQAYREAFAALDLVVVIDVAMTETAEHADYILPAQTQYEKSEAAFFTFMFPENFFYLRKPIVEPQGDTLPEPEIYRRLLVAMGELPDDFPELEKLAREYVAQPESGSFAMAFQMALAQNKNWSSLASVILYATLGKALPPEKQSAAALWGVCQFYAHRYQEQVRRAGYDGVGHMLGENLFRAILDDPTAVPISKHTYEEAWSLIRHDDGKIHLWIPEMVEEILDLAVEEAVLDPDFPLILAAGERRDYNANQIVRDPNWRRNDRDGALRIHPDDAADSGVVDGARVRCETSRGGIEVTAAIDPAQRRGFLSLPHGYGLEYPDLQSEEMVQVGPRLNEITSAAWCDPIAKTPYHKYIPVRVQPVG
ncbi:MAG: molybdopterin-dependent oxidoreductase [Ardenticatenaceae bacterium]|nr:molybdopterin-dependent oxidoreductase [Ardenticatenaceae bacterium]